MENRNLRPLSFLFATLLAALCLGAGAPASALGFKVHGYDLGERIELLDGRRVWTAELDVSLEKVADHVASFCVDIDSDITTGLYSTIGVYDASTAPAGPAPTGARDFAWAGHVMQTYGHDVDLLVGTGVTRDQAITGVQAAIWERLYAGPIIRLSSLSVGARTVFDRIIDDVPPFATGALIIDLPRNQDQVIAHPSHPVPEPSAALVFGLGTVVAGSFVRRRSR